ncbi:LCP family protein [Diaminobutyricimonas sp. LJ205]|uniref:LCP family protein n=1 Tax=Diaminobutyricimonas sp. LJ205 TaxID=2683590 RepID=UPI0012F4B65A|nr:LCP family protein [Diaminobutyricimonas sp. LJ205]
MSDRRPRGAGRRQVALAHHGRLRRSHGWTTVLKGLALGLAVVMVSAVAVVAITAWRITTGINTVNIGEGPVAAPPTIGAYPGGFNVLIVANDTRTGQDARYGKTESDLNDVNMLLHVSADHSRAIAVSIPRDTRVTIPDCVDENGNEVDGSRGVMINQALSRGGLGCVVSTVEELTDLDIQFAGMITFKGVVELSNAVGGVPVCIDGPLVDRHSGINLPEAGTHVLAGEEAVAFLRTRYSVGDGSDLARNASQRVYLSSLVRELKSADTLGDPLKVYQIAEVAIANMKVSESLGNVNTMISLAAALKDIPLHQVQFVQFPTEYSGGFSRLVPNSVLAGELFDAIRSDAPFQLAAGETGKGAVADPKALAAETSAPQTPQPETSAPEPGGDASPTPTPDATTPPAGAPTVIDGLEGQTAADHTCSATR